MSPISRGSASIAIPTSWSASFEASGCGTGYVQRDPARQLGLYLIALADGERSFTYWRETSAARRLADDAVLLGAALEAAEVIYFSGITLAIIPSAGRELLIRLVAEATRRGALTAFDPNIRTALWSDPAVMRESMTRAASASTVVLPSYSDEAAAFGDGTPTATAARYAAAGAREVVVKDGAADTIVFASGRTVAVTPQLVAVVDTTGAGDSFNGAYLAARLNGLPPEAAAREGQRVAGIVVGRQGAIVPAAEVVMPAAGWRDSAEDHRRLGEATRCDRPREGHAGPRFGLALGRAHPLLRRCHEERREIVAAECRAAHPRGLEALLGEEAPRGIVAGDAAQAPLRVPEPPLRIHYRAVRCEALASEVDVEPRFARRPAGPGGQRLCPDPPEPGVGEVGELAPRVEADGIGMVMPGMSWRNSPRHNRRCRRRQPRPSCP